MRNTRQYAILNIKEKTLTEYFICSNDFGRAYVHYSQTIIDYAECKKYVNPYVHFINLANKYLTDEKNELCEILENKTYAQMIEKYESMVF